MIRRPGRVVVGLCALTLAGCGTAATPPTHAHNSGRLPASKLPAVAHQINLTTAELPGYRAAPTGQSVWRPQARPFAHCLHVARTTPAAVGVSRLLTSKGGLSGGQLSSLTTTYHSTADAQKMISALRSQRAPQCLQASVLAYLSPAAADNELTLKTAVQITPLPISITGHPISFAYRMALTAQPTSPSQQQFTIYADLFGFTLGPALTELATYSSGQPFPSSIEQRLVDRLSRLAHTTLASSAP